MPIPVPPQTPATIPERGGLGIFYVHSVAVETFVGVGPYGDAYWEPRNVPCFLDDGTHLVRNKNGEEVVSMTTIFADPQYADALIADSRVTANGRVAYVITVNSHDSGPLNLPDHVEAHLT